MLNLIKFFIVALWDLWFIIIFSSRLAQVASMINKVSFSFSLFEDVISEKKKRRYSSRRLRIVRSRKRDDSLNARVRVHIEKERKRDTGHCASRAKVTAGTGLNLVKGPYKIPLCARHLSKGRAHPSHAETLPVLVIDASPRVGVHCRCFLRRTSCLTPPSSADFIRNAIFPLLAHPFSPLLAHPFSSCRCPLLILSFYSREAAS